MIVSEKSEERKTPSERQKKRVERSIEKKNVIGNATSCSTGNVDGRALSLNRTRCGGRRD